MNGKSRGHPQEYRKGRNSKNLDQESGMDKATGEREIESKETPRGLTSWCESKSGKHMRPGRPGWWRRPADWCPGSWDRLAVSGQLPCVEHRRDRDSGSQLISRSHFSQIVSSGWIHNLYLLEKRERLKTKKKYTGIILLQKIWLINSGMLELYIRVTRTWNRGLGTWAAGNLLKLP